MQQMPRIANVLDSVRHTSLFRALIPQEAGVGWPIPLRRAGRIYVVVPFYGYEYNKESKQTNLFPPFATLTLQLPSQLPVEYVNLRYNNPWPEGNWEEHAGVFPHLAVAHLSVEQYKQQREELLAKYDEMIALLGQGGTFSSAWIQEFSQQLALLMEPGLKPFYCAIAPKFFNRFLPSGGQS